MEPTPDMIEAAAQRLVRWEDGCTWPDSWDELTVAAARLDAERALRSGLNAAPKPQPAVPDGRPTGRPDNFEFAMDFLGDPEAASVREYIEHLEVKAGQPQPAVPEPDWTPYLMLAEFGRQCFQIATSDGGRDIEWEHAFDIAQEAELLVPVQRDEPCYGEGGQCMCDDVGVDFPTTCYRPTEKLNGVLFREIKRPEPPEPNQ